MKKITNKVTKDPERQEAVRKTKKIYEKIEESILNDMKKLVLRVQVM